MANSYPILPASVLDELNDLNAALGAYDLLMTAWINQATTEGLPVNTKQFAAGCQYLLRPILEGFQGIESQASAFHEMGVVGSCQLAETDQ